jgi:preprotein translocase subunit SecF
MQFFKDTRIDFLGKKKLCYVISITAILISLGALLFKGPTMGIEFTGGTLLQAKFKELPPIDKIRDALNAGGFQGYSVQTQPANESIIIRIKQGDQSKEDISGRIMTSLKAAFGENVNELPERVEFVGPVIGKKLAFDAMMAILGSLGVIVIYVAFRFRNWVWGLVGVLALAHDVFITFGLLVILQREVTLVVIAALLTLAGYSINDTIVIFDRVRENMRSARRESLMELYNRTINETLSRTFNTSFMALIAASSLFFGGEVLFDFALTMSFGILIGSYSTIFVCIALIHQWETRGKKA